MKFTEAKNYFSALSVICLAISVLLIFRELLYPDKYLIWMILNFILPIFGIFIFTRLYGKDGYAVSPAEVLFVVFVFYCAINFTATTIITLLNFLAASSQLLLFCINFAICAFGWLGIFYYLYF